MPAHSRLPMIVAIATWDLHLPGCHSLKEKRGVLKPLTIGLRRTLNVSVAETGQQDLWQRAEIACAVVGSARPVVEEILRAADRDGRGDRRGAHRGYGNGVPMKGSSRRPEQVAETLRQVITDALVREVRDPRVGFVTVTARAGHQRPVPRPRDGERAR